MSKEKDSTLSIHVSVTDTENLNSISENPFPLSKHIGNLPELTTEREIVRKSKLVHSCVFKMKDSFPPLKSF